MALASQLPVDILFRISAFITVDADKSLGHWKHGLSLLSICSHWRATIVPLVFKTLTIEVVPYDEADIRGYMYEHGERMFSAAFSNYQLAKQNGHLCWAQHLCFYGLDDEDCTYSMALVADALEMDENDVPGIAYLRCWHESDIDTGEHLTDKKWGEKVCQAAREMARLLRQRLPGITALTVELKCELPWLIDFGDELMHVYIGQLAQLNAELWSESDPPILPGLQQLAIQADCLDNSNQYICAQNIKSLDLALCGGPFSWSIFRGSDAASNLVFGKLENLIIKHGGPFSTLYKSIDVSFRVLQRLHIIDTALPPEFYKTIFNSPIRTLIYEGTLADAQSIFTSNVGVLDTLDLQFANFGENMTREMASALSNQMFKCAKGIRVVRCDILNIANFNIGLLNWQNVTHVKFQAPVNFELILKFLVNMPSLVAFKLVLHPQMQFIVSDSNIFLSNIRSIYSQPTNSELFHLEILYHGDTPPYSEDAMANLRWLFPKLKNLNFKKNN